MKRIIILLSGDGSNFQAILDACFRKEIKGSIVAVFSNNAAAYGLERARAAHIPAHALLLSDFASRDTFDRALLKNIDQYQPDLVVLAGYLRVLSSFFVTHYSGRLLNIHPSLLPKYPGLHTHREVLKSGDRDHGASVHFVTQKLDAGPVILQAKTPVLSNDNEDSLKHRVQALEHRIYPRVIRWFIENRLTMHNDIAWLDNAPLLLPKQLSQADNDD